MLRRSTAFSPSENRYTDRSAATPVRVDTNMTTSPPPVFAQTTTTSSNNTRSAIVPHDHIIEELNAVKAERDFYHNKLMRVKEKLSEGRHTTPQEFRKQLTPKTKKSKKKKQPSDLKSLRGSVKSKSRSRSASKSALSANSRKSAECTNLNIKTGHEQQILNDSTSTYTNKARLKPLIMTHSYRQHKPMNGTESET